MTYHEISSEAIVARIDNSYTITNSTDWINRSPEWIVDALAIIDMPLSYKMQEPYEMPIVARKGKLPCNLERVLYILKDGKSMAHIQDGKMRNPNPEIPMSGIYYYEYTRSGHIVCNFDNGTVFVYYKGLDSSYNRITGLKFPYIPFNRVLMTSLESYVIWKVLSKGGMVLGQSLSENNPFTNPALAWNESLKRVRIALLDDSAEQMENIEDSLKGFIKTPGGDKDKRDYLSMGE